MKKLRIVSLELDAEDVEGDVWPTAALAQEHKNSVGRY